MAQRKILKTAKHRERVIEVAEGEFLILEERPEFVDTEVRDGHRAEVDDDINDVLEKIDETQAEFEDEEPDNLDTNLGTIALLDELYAIDTETDQLLADFDARWALLLAKTALNAAT